MTHKTPQWFRSSLTIFQNYWRYKTKVRCFFASLIDQPVIASRIHAIRDGRSNGKRHVQVRVKLRRTLQEVAGVVSLWDNHLSSHLPRVVYAGFVVRHLLAEGMLRAQSPRSSRGENDWRTCAEQRGVASGSSICTYAMVGWIAVPV